jgi:hypothetical protein
VFDPCVNEKSKKLLYLRFSVGSYEKIAIIDFTQTPNVVLPRDVLNQD